MWNWKDAQPQEPYNSTLTLLWDCERARWAYQSHWSYFDIFRSAGATLINLIAISFSSSVIALKLSEIPYGKHRLWTLFGASYKLLWGNPLSLGQYMINNDKNLGFKLLRLSKLNMKLTALLFILNLKIFLKILQMMLKTDTIHQIMM